MSTPVAAIRCSAARSASSRTSASTSEQPAAAKARRAPDRCRSRSGDHGDRAVSQLHPGEPSARRRYRAGRARGGVRGGDPHPRLALAQGPAPGRALAAGRGTGAVPRVGRRGRRPGHVAAGDARVRGRRVRGADRRGDRSTRSIATCGRGRRSRCSTARRTGSNEHVGHEAFTSRWLRCSCHASITFRPMSGPKVGSGA